MFFKTTVQPTAASGHLGDHAAIVAEQAEDERQLAAVLTTLRADIARDEARRKELQAILDDVLAHQRRLESDALLASHAYDARTSRREKQLRDLADPRIEAQLNWIARERDGLSRHVRYGDRPGGIDPRSGRTLSTETVCLNWDAVQLVSEALDQARDRTKALKFQTVPDVATALEEIRRSIPSVDQAEQLGRDRKVA